MNYSQLTVKTREVFEYLKDCASKMRIVTYGEIADEVGLAKPEVGKPLRFIRDEVCRSRGLPWLNAIAVNFKTGRPGRGFLPTDFAITRADEEALWRGMVLQVFAYNWTTVDFEA